MLTCKEVSQLASKAQDEPLTFKERLQLKVHLLICSLCARYVKQLHFLKRAIQGLDEHKDDVRLSTKSRHRIKASLENQSKHEPKYPND